MSKAKRSINGHTWMDASIPSQVSLENYVALLRKAGYVTDATLLELRAKAIRAKHAQDD